MDNRTSEDDDSPKSIWSRVDEIYSEAQIAIVAERNLDVRSALRLYPKAAAWSLFFSLGVIMTGFDPQVIGNLYGVPSFQKDFGYYFDGGWNISPAWQSGLRYFLSL